MGAWKSAIAFDSPATVFAEKVMVKGFKVIQQGSFEEGRIGSSIHGHSGIHASSSARSHEFTTARSEVGQTDVQNQFSLGEVSGADLDFMVRAILLLRVRRLRRTTRNSRV